MDVLIISMFLKLIQCRRSESSTVSSLHPTNHVRARSQPFRSRSNLTASSSPSNTATVTAPTLKPVTLTMQNRRWVN